MLIVYHFRNAENAIILTCTMKRFLIFQVFAWKIYKARNQYCKRVDIGIMLARTEYSTKTDYRSNRKMQRLYSRASMIMKFNYPQFAPSRVIEHDNYCRGRTFKFPVLGNRKMFVIRARQLKARAWDLKPIYCIPGVQYLPKPFIIFFRLSLRGTLLGPVLVIRSILKLSCLLFCIYRLALTIKSYFLMWSDTRECREYRYSSRNIKVMNNNERNKMTVT